MKKNNQKTLFSAPDGKSYLVPFILITSLFLLWGFAHGLLDVLNKHFQGVFTMTKAESGLVQFSTYIAYFLMALPAGMFMKRFGYKKGIILGLCLFAVGAFAFIPAAYLHSASPFLIALFVIACGLCILETAANPYSTILGPEESGAQRLNLSQSFNGLGWILGPLVGGMLIFGGAEDDPFTLTKPYILVGSVVLLVAILFFFTKLPEVQEETDKEEKTIAPVSGTASMWRHPQFIRAIIAQFCYCAAQTGIFSFFINYVTEVDTSMTNIEASRILAFGGMALFMIGRLSGSFTMRWMSPARLLTWFALADAVCMALVVVSVGTVSLYALYLSFFFMSIMFPTIFALGLEGMGSYTKKASSYIVMGVAGGAFAPMLMGYIGADNMAVGFVIPLLSFLYILYFALRCKRE
ncbi:L-fucose:H+ symporter permease [Parabacteroides johnsonii]|uniref:L-fucose:H+ symporter permease n=1 Tax=Parabacteroides johnsonii CL02T12C29 TaxID=999419 RepID=K5ZCK7_9BACT|nr:L-fucose:H+ symporter permease [Parabacteroides johnsonii]EKN13374.1 L-fucose:H+ symporter permease [Parabacteroides johnsonii CL02T12C29]